MNEIKKETKMEAAIRDTELRLKSVSTDIMLLIKKKETLEEQLKSLNIINENSLYDNK